MAVINFLGGLTGAYTNIKAGYQEAQARDRAEEDRKFQLEQRDLESKKIKATKDEMERQEKLRTANAGVSLEETVEVPDDTAPSTPVAPVRNGVAEVDGDANPVTVDPATGISPPATRKVTRQRRMEDVYRDFAKNSQSVGDTTGYLTMSAQSVQAAANRASSQFTRIAAASTGKTTEQLAEELRQLYDTDILPGKVGKVTRGADGSVDIQFIDNETQQTFTQNFKDAGQLMTVAQSYFDPVNYAKQVDARRAHLMKLEEERNKVHSVAPRAVLARGDGSVLVSNPMYSRDYDSDGSGGSGGSGGAGGSGGGRASKKGQPTELEIGDGVLDDALKGKNSDINPSQHVQVKDTYRRLMTENPTMPGQMGARVALAITVDPTLVKPDIDPMTGRISNVYKDPATDEEFVIRPGVGSATRIPQDAEGKPILSADAMRVGAQKTLQFISDKFGQNVAKLYQNAAFDSTGKGRTELNNALRPIMEQEAAKEPRWASLPADAKATVIQRMLDANQDQINLIRNFGTPPAGEGAANRLKAGVGIGIPDRVRADIEKEAAASRAKREADAKAKQQKSAERDKLKGEIRGLNDEMITRMTPNEAEAFERRYRAALTMDQRTKLIDRSMDKIPGIGDRTPMGF